ncbi:MAG TPA: FxDxF family PEP-CTERM protein, partial [Rubrivivax sp.]|nr:FxDxF family PEP-CTERM protein [Rubrivivax sp.]
MKLTRLAAVAALAVASSSGYAVAINLTPTDLGAAGTATFANTPIAGAFTDTLTFTLTTASFLTGSVTSVVSGTQDIDFTSISVTGTGGPFPFMMALADPFETWTRASVALAAGTYTLTLTGTNSSSIASYAGTLGVTPVPEAGTVAMM